MLMTPTPAGAVAVLPPPEPPAFRLLIDLTRGRISVRGDLDRAHVGQLADGIAALHRSPAPLWSVDAAGITFCDAGGLRGLVQASETAARAGRTLVVTRPSHLLARLLVLVSPEGPGMAAADDGA
jgi:anti-anti-sigma regulatory factor